jgi:c(7)-type cytochrome triheme protein
MKRFLIVLAVIAALMLVTSAFAGMKTYVYKDGELGPVTFDGKIHNTKLGPGKCMECHKGNVPFAMKAPGSEGSAKITKADHVEGKFCGTCHDGKKSFGWQEGSDCTKCHKKAEAIPTSPAPAAPASAPAPAAPASATPENK